MRYFKIYNQNVTKSRPLQEISEDQFTAELTDYCLDQMNFFLNDEDFDREFSRLFLCSIKVAKCSEGLDTGDFYLYGTEDDTRTVLDYSRKNR